LDNALIEDLIDNRRFVIRWVVHHETVFIDRVVDLQHHFSGGIATEEHRSVWQIIVINPVLFYDKQTGHGFTGVRGKDHFTWRYQNAVTVQLCLNNDCFCRRDEETQGYDQTKEDTFERHDKFPLII